MAVWGTLRISITEYDVNIFKKMIDINLMGVYYAMRYVLPVMQKQQYGRIVNVASVGGIRGVFNQVPSVASKHAIYGMTKNAALDYGKDGITTNAIAPGAICTPMVAEAFKQLNPQDPKAAKLIKPGTPESVTNMAWLKPGFCLIFAINTSFCLLFPPN